jgi:hypothetical protein
MDAPTMTSPAVVIGETPNEKQANYLDVSCNTVAPDTKEDVITAESNPVEPPMRLPQNWSNKRKWLIVTAISGVSFVV